MKGVGSGREAFQVDISKVNHMNVRETSKMLHYIFNVAHQGWQ